MDVVQKAMTDAVQAVRNSPLLRRRFGGGRHESTPDGEPGARALTPEKTARTPFVQGFTYNVEYLGKAAVEPGQEQDHGCTDRAVELLWSDAIDLGKAVAIRVTMSNITIKLMEDRSILYDFPVLRISYCALDERHPQAVSFVARDDDDGRFSCFVFRVSSKQKAYAMALSVTKAFSLACQILQEQEGLFPPTPERESLFEPQHDDDTKVSPLRPVITASPPTSRANYTLETHKEQVDSTPNVQVTRPSVSSIDSNVDEDFVRLAKARSDPDILRSTLEKDDVIHPSLDLIRQHADANSQATTPIGSQENLLNL